MLTCRSTTTPGAFGPSKSPSMPKDGWSSACAPGTRRTIPSRPTYVLHGSKPQNVCFRLVSPVYGFFAVQLGPARHVFCPSYQGAFSTGGPLCSVPDGLGKQIYSVNRTKPLTARRLKQLEDEGQGFLPLSAPLEFSVQPFEEYEAAYKKDPREPKD